MKAIFIFILLLASAVSANAQTDTTQIESDSVEVKIVPLPDSTALGTPMGKKVSKEIGTSGGTIVSDDGKLELIFPADALTKPTQISIQPITTVIPNGNKAYHFEPSGIQFQKPVQIIFHYTDEEAEICPPELKFMALQDHKGKWEYIDYENWDSTTKSLKGFISHFSAYVDGNEVELNNTVITLKVGKFHQFALNVVQPPLSSAEDVGDELPLLPTTVQRRNREALWKVNDRIGGTAKHGTIAPIQGQAIKATYTAPAKLTADSIKIKLQLNDVFIEQITERGGRRRRFRTVRRTPNLAIFTCKVNLYDEYKVTVSQDVKVDGGQMTDTAAFHLRIGIEDRASISNIYNINAKVHIRQNRCRAIYVNAATCVGMINVTGIKTSNLTATPDGLVRVAVIFKPSAMIFPVIHFPPCGGNRASITTPSATSTNAFPMWLNFEAKNEKQYISLGTGAVVRRPNPEDITATIEPIRE